MTERAMFMRYLPMGLFALLAAALDQVSKFLVVEHIPYGTAVPCIPGVVHLTYVQNFGAAFSFLQGHRWLFVLAFVVLVALLGLGLNKKMLPFTRLGLWFLAAALGGGLGNIIDRVFRGYVVDMIAVEFISFPVFNLADCFITCGAALLLIHLVFWNKSFWKEDKHGADLS